MNCYNIVTTNGSYIVIALDMVSAINLFQQKKPAENFPNLKIVSVTLSESQVLIDNEVLAVQVETPQSTVKVSAIEELPAPIEEKPVSDKIDISFVKDGADKPLISVEEKNVIQN